MNALMYALTGGTARVGGAAEGSAAPQYQSIAHGAICFGDFAPRHTGRYNGNLAARQQA